MYRIGENQMKNRDYNIGIDYEIKIMSSLELKEKLMKDNNLTEEDIFFHYSLNNMSEINIEYTDVLGRKDYESKYSYMDRNSILSNYLQYKKGISLDKTVRMFIGKMDIQEICEKRNITEKPFTDSNGITYNDFFEKHQIYHIDDSLYKEVPYQDAIVDIVHYNIEIFNKQRAIPDEPFNQGIENSCIVINEKSDGKYELLDGFYRILYKNIDRNVIVKVYKNITDEQWFKLMLNLNYWKTKDSKDLFYDRGFLLGLRCRYGIKMEDYIFTKSSDWSKNNSLVDILSQNIEPISINHHFQVREIAKNKGLSEILYNRLVCGSNADSIRKQLLINKYFVNDLKTIQNYLGYLPENILKLKKIQDVDIFSSYTYQKFLSNIIKLIFAYRINNLGKDMNELPADLIDIIFKDKEIKDSFVKAVGMSINGYIDNRLELLYPNLILIFDELLLKKEE